MKFGFPPKLIKNGEELNHSINCSLHELGIRNNDSIEIIKNNQENFNYLEKVEISLVVKIIPNDNSCLFNSIGYSENTHKLNAFFICIYLYKRYLLFDKTLKKSDELRQLIATIILSDPSKYNYAYLGRSPNDYADWILKRTSWGGGIEIAIFSDFFQIEIASIDISTLRVDIFGKIA